jgi:tetratricopeptide (TPR) repeat protein
MLLLIWVSLYSLQLRFDIAKGEVYKGEEFLYLPKAEYIKTASLGFDQVVADLLWLKAVQHIGERKISSQGYEWIYKAIDTVTSLDPKFKSPYEVGGLILSMSDKVDMSNKLLTKAFENNPEVWQFPFYLSFNYYYYLKDYKQAAAWTSKAAAIKGSPYYLPLLASRLYTQADDPAYALEFLSRMYENTSDEKVREDLLRRMNLLKAEVEIRAMQQAADFFRKNMGAEPKTLDELVSAGLLKYIPEEPNGGRYYMDGQGVVKSTKLTQRLGVFRQGER